MCERLGSTPPILSKALEVKTLNRNLLETIEKIAFKVNSFLTFLCFSHINMVTRVS
jgi:hypothetical protein